MLRRLLVLLSAAVSVVVAGLVITGSAQAAPTTGGTVTAPVTGTTSNGGSFAGTFTPTKFTAQNGQLLATGTLAGTITNPDGTTQAVSTTVTDAVTAAAGSCRILDLTLGPLHLDLLGLVIDLNQIHLTITAQQGPGNLLGNLLCAVAGLLNGPTGLNTTLQQIANLLNQILALL